MYTSSHEKLIFYKFHFLYRWKSEYVVLKWMCRLKRNIFFPGLSFYVYIENTNPTKSIRLHNAGPKPHQLKYPSQKLNPKPQSSKTQNPKPP